MDCWIFGLRNIKLNPFESSTYAVSRKNLCTMTKHLECQVGIHTCLVGGRFHYYVSATTWVITYRLPMWTLTYIAKTTLPRLNIMEAQNMCDPVMNDEHVIRVHAWTRKPWRETAYLLHATYLVRITRGRYVVNYILTWTPRPSAVILYRLYVTFILYILWRVMGYVTNK
jgi:hypothetical protein